MTGKLMAEAFIDIPESQRLINAGYRQESSI